MGLKKILDSEAVIHIGTLFLMFSSMLLLLGLQGVSVLFSKDIEEDDFRLSQAFGGYFIGQAIWLAYEGWFGSKLIP